MTPNRTNDRHLSKNLLLRFESISPQAILQLLQPSLNNANSTDRSPVIALFHNNFIGHAGITATVKRLTSYGHSWSKTMMTADVATYIKQSPHCQLH